MTGKQRKRFHKNTIVAGLREIMNHGWYDMGHTAGHSGCAGVYLERLLGVQDTNAPGPDMGVWELKTRLKETNSLLTLFQLEPSPRRFSTARFLVERYGWSCEGKDSASRENWLSFRQTVACGTCTSRGFSLAISEGNLRTGGARLLLLFDPEEIAPVFGTWRQELLARGAHLGMTPQPYWLLSDVFRKASAKLSHCIYVTADIRCCGARRHVKYESFTMLSGLYLENMLDMLRSREMVIYINARSGHNHGSQFRIKPRSFMKLYSHVQVYS